MKVYYTPLPGNSHPRLVGHADDLPAAARLVLDHWSTADRLYFYPAPHYAYINGENAIEVWPEERPALAAI